MGALTVRRESVGAGGATIVLPGQQPDGQEILSVLLKRTFDIVPRARCPRAEADAPLIPGDVHWGSPMNSTVRFESDYVPFKLATDVVLVGTAHAPRGIATASCSVALRVGQVEKRLQVTGDRRAQYVQNGTPIFTDPVPFERMELTYERAYGGTDVYSNKATIYPYPRNPLGRGFAVLNRAEQVENLALPNIEDSDAPITAERLCVGAYPEWEHQPQPAGFGWFPRTWLPRAALAGVMPADRATERELRKAYGALVPAEQRELYLTHGLPDMDFRFFSGASAGLAVPFLEGGETVTTEGLAPEGKLVFQLPDDRPAIGLDIGAGPHEPPVVLHTAMIRMDDRQVDLVWRAAVPYEGRDALPGLRKMEVLLT